MRRATLSQTISITLIRNIGKVSTIPIAASQPNRTIDIASRLAGNNTIGKMKADVETMKAARERRTGFTANGSHGAVAACCCSRRVVE